jgi:hypothetical protein
MVNSQALLQNPHIHPKADTQYKLSAYTLKKRNFQQAPHP